MKKVTNFLSVLFVVAAVLAVPDESLADAPFCSTSSGTGYCEYSGTVKQAYVNRYNSILFYFDTPLDLSEPAAVGISDVTKSTAAIVLIDDNPKFADYFYSSVLAAQASGRVVRVQMRGVSSGYLKIDRIWVLE